MQLNDLVDIAGVLGFVLSLCLAILQLMRNRLRIFASPIILIDANPKAPNSIFLMLTLANKISLPFSLTSVGVKDTSTGKIIPVETTVRTYMCHPTEKRLAVKPVVLSQAFPARFEPYESKVFLLELLRRNIDTKALRPGDPTHNPGEQSRIQHLLDMPYRHQLPLRLVMNTSRGRREVPIFVSENQSWDFLEKYAVQKAAYEEKIVFP